LPNVVFLIVLSETDSANEEGSYSPLNQL
jgi:hypothetical protein